MSITESTVEDAVVAQFGAAGASTVGGAALDEAGERSSASAVVLPARARRALRKLNAQLPAASADAVVSYLSRPPHATLIENNRWFHDLLTNGVPVEYKDAVSGETRGGRARLIDFENPAANDFLVVRQLMIAGFQRQDAAATGKMIRLDLILYVNGLPLVVIELKDPANTAATLDVAIDQLGRYKTVAPDLFVPNLLLVASDGLLTRVGSVTSGRRRFTPWRPTSGGEPTLESLISELLNPAALLDYLRSCVAFEEDERGNIVKKVAGYHQFRAVRKGRARVIEAMKRRGTGFQPVNSPDQRQDAAATLRIRWGAYLPHWTREGATYAVTFRLGDSLPQSVVSAWQREREEILGRARQMNRPLSKSEEERLEHLFSEKVETFLDAGSGHCWMNRPEIADLVEGALKHFDGERYRLLAWCVMPNHVHVVVHPLPGHTLEQITHSWKSYTATQANRLLGRQGEFWQKESYDHLIRDEEDLQHAIKYTRENPGKAGLKDWRWCGSGFQGVIPGNSSQRVDS